MALDSRHDGIESTEQICRREKIGKDIDPPLKCLLVGPSFLLHDRYPKIDVPALTLSPTPTAGVVSGGR
jgi:hypothetical protein